MGKRNTDKAYKRRNWTSEEEELLEELWGTKSIKLIAKNLQRSIDSVKNKASEMSLGCNLYQLGITFVQLAESLRLSYSTIRNSWLIKNNLPAKRVISAEEKKVWVVQIDDFWKWVSEHQDIVNLSRMPEGALGFEPDWVKRKRDLDKMDSERLFKRKWTKQEEDFLLSLLKIPRYGYPEVAKALNRSENAVKRKLYDMGVKIRPNCQPRYGSKEAQWTPSQEQQLWKWLSENIPLNIIAEKLGKSTLAVEGKIYRSKKKNLLQKAC